IHFETYIYRSDRTGMAFADALAARARAGVTVRLLVDAVGSMELDRSCPQQLQQAGVKFSLWKPLAWTSGMGINRRDHRKILVVDGQVGFTGGLNIGDEYASADEGGGGWHDMHVRVE